VDIRKARPKVLPDPMVRVKAFAAGVAASAKMAQAYFILIAFFSGLGTRVLVTDARFLALYLDCRLWRKNCDDLFL